MNTIEMYITLPHRILKFVNITRFLRIISVSTGMKLFYFCAIIMIFITESDCLLSASKGLCRRICSCIQKRCHRKVRLEASISLPPPPIATQSNEVIDKQDNHTSLFNINAMMFLFYCTLGAAMPYLPVYYKRIGVSDDFIGILGAITPAITFIVSPLWGALADETGKHQEIMLFTFLGSIIFRSLLMLKHINIYGLSLIVALSAILNAPVKPLMDSAVMSMLTDKSDYGRSRLFGQFGFGFGSYLAGTSQTLALSGGLLATLFSNMKSIFIIQNLFALPTAYLMAYFRPIKKNDSTTSSSSASTITSSITKAKDEKEDKKSMKKVEDSTKLVEEKLHVMDGLKHVMKDKEILLFFFIVFIIGLSSGIIENFAYVRINQLLSKGDTSNCLGICRLMSSIAGGPMFYLSGKITQFLGIQLVLCISLVAYILRFIIYATITNPWHAIPAEMLRGVSFALFWAGCTYYVYQSTPKGLSATMLGILNGIYGGIGQSAGSLIGGYLSKHLSIAKTFLYSAVVDGVLLSTYGIYELYRYYFGNKGVSLKNDSNTMKSSESGHVSNIQDDTPKKSK